MLMMRLQRVGRRNDPAYRIVVTNKRTGPKSDKHVARLGSYNPKLNHIQLDKEAAKEWLTKGVQPSDTMHNILVNEKVIDAKKINVLPRKSPIVDEEAAAKVEAEKAAAETPAEDVAEETAEEASAEETAEETETPAEKEKTEDTTAEEEKTEEAPAEEAAESDDAEEEKKEE